MEHSRDAAEQMTTALEDAGLLPPSPGGLQRVQRGTFDEDRGVVVLQMQLSMLAGGVHQGHAKRKHPSIFDRVSDTAQLPRPPDAVVHDCVRQVADRLHGRKRADTEPHQSLWLYRLVEAMLLLDGLVSENSILHQYIYRHPNNLELYHDDLYHLERLIDHGRLVVGLNRASVQAEENARQAEIQKKMEHETIHKVHTDVLGKNTGSDQLTDEELSILVKRAHANEINASLEHARDQNLRHREYDEL